MPLYEIRQVREPQITDLIIAPGDWVLVCNADGTPFGWMDDAGVDVYRSGKSLYDSVIAGGSLFGPDGTLRQALDAALSSPCGLGVAIDADGRVRGGVRGDDVLTALDRQRRNGQR
ncbi:amino acid ABC transporter ATP-binding protein [Mycobacteroides abscessus subsp. abscessus]|nr:amino acid ABC transporter ATP-binding protein [Mycobacteroides abscessus subsp. abscessus]